jgi:hypothetical protein
VDGRDDRAGVGEVIQHQVSAGVDQLVGGVPAGGDADDGRA